MIDPYIKKPFRNPHVRRLWDTAVRGWSAVIIMCVAGAALALGPWSHGTAATIAIVFFILAGAAAILTMVRMGKILAALKAERTLIVEAFESSHFGRAICDAKGNAVFISDSFWTLVNPDIREAEAAIMAQYGKDGKTRQILDNIRQSAHAGKPLTAIFHLNRLGQSEEWHEIQARPVPSWPGYVVWRVEDVTEQYKAQQDLKHEQEKLADFLDNAPAGFFSVDEQGRFLYVNQAFAEWIGMLPEAIIGTGRKLHDLFAHPPASAAPYEIAPGGSTHQRAELVLKGNQGRLYQLAITQSVLKNGDDRIRTHAVARDLTPEREWQEALRLSEQRFQRFFEDAPVGIALVDQSRRITECNKALLTLLGHDGPEAILNRSVEDLVRAEDKEKVSSGLNKLLTQGGLLPALEVRLPGSREMVCHMYARSMEDGNHQGLILHFIDVTEQKNLQVQFVQSQKMQAIGQLAGGVAHDFNNLLTAMIGFCDLLLLRHKPGDQSFSDIMQIKQNANRAANLVRQLLAFSRQQTLQPSVLNVTDVLADLANLLRRLIGENIELKMNHGNDLGPVLVDQGQLEQVIINLVVNARDAMPGGGKLGIVTSNVTSAQPVRRNMEVMPPGEWVTIEVTDTGVGIPPENLQRIFEPFFSTKEVGAGTGLGLSTVYGIVRQTGGYVFVDSAPGKGARFTIYLPRHHGTADASRVMSEADGKEKTNGDLTGAGTILLVEDEDAVRIFSARALRNKGYQVLEARNGEDALEQLAKSTGQIDLLVTDVVMPNMDGPTLVRKVRQTHPTMKAIFISGYTEDRLREHFNEGEIHFLPKPFSLKQLASKVKDVLA